ncbi:testis development-related protein isoform X3 [Mauremys reevesii]|uniref:testis development-related protein isoform X3 n=1 Tax=Mauremys reevesii TaxID=260615 RepID=UPI00194018C6|nr:testis development-related protein isoform X3 [Mauremys reevesii]
MSEAGRSRAGCRGDRKARAPPALSQTWQRPLGGSGPRLPWGKVTVPGLSEAGPPRPIMWKLNKSSKVLLDDSPDEEETRLRDPPPPPPQPAASAAAQVQSASFRGWKEVTSMFNKDDEQQLLAGCKAPKSKGTNLKLKEDVKSEKKFGFWDSLAIKQNTQSRKPDQIEGWEPPQITAGDPISDAGNTLSDYPSWSGWEDETKGSTKYTNLASSGNSSRWSIKSAGKLVSIRRQSKGNLTDNWEELE